MLNVTWTFCILRFWHTIPVQFIVVAPAFLLVGGGYTVVIAVLYALAADVEPDANRCVYHEIVFEPALIDHTRASAFFLM